MMEIPEADLKGENIDQKWMELATEL